MYTCIRILYYLLSPIRIPHFPSTQYFFNMALIHTASMMVVASLVGQPEPINVDIDLDRTHLPFPHYFERCVGSGHGALTMREDWRNHVAMAHKDLGIERVRFHGILDDVRYWWRWWWYSLFRK